MNEILIQEGDVTLHGTLTIPANPKGLVIFAHGSGSSRLSPRNRLVAGALNEAGLATLLFDLLTEEESLDRSNVFDIPLLSDRLRLATRWVRKFDVASALPVGYFGASTGAAAALTAAADLGGEISAVVSRGGRPDLAMDRLGEVKAPTLLLVGGFDGPVVSMNEQALRRLSKGTMIVIPGATHLFEEPGTLEQVAREAAGWFLSHLGGRKGKPARAVA